MFNGRVDVVQVKKKVMSVVPVQPMNTLQRLCEPVPAGQKRCYFVPFCEVNRLEEIMKLKVLENQRIYFTSHHFPSYLDVADEWPNTFTDQVGHSVTFKSSEVSFLFMEVTEDELNSSMSGWILGLMALSLIHSAWHIFHYIKVSWL